MTPIAVNTISDQLPRKHWLRGLDGLGGSADGLSQTSDAVRELIERLYCRFTFAFDE